jgi:hypothetical protein
MFYPEIFSMEVIGKTKVDDDKIIMLVVGLALLLVLSLGLGVKMAMDGGAIVGYLSRGFSGFFVRFVLGVVLVLLVDYSWKLISNFIWKVRCVDTL